MRIQLQYLTTMSRGVRLAVFGFLIAGCTSQEAPEAEPTDSGAVREVTSLKKYKGTKSNGDGLWRICEESTAPAPLKLSIKHGKLTAINSEIDALEAAAYSECFMQDTTDATVGRSAWQHDQAEFVQGKQKTILRYQPAAFAKNMKIATLLPGQGYIAGMYLAVAGGPFKAGNIIMVHPGSASLLWMGKDLSDSLISAVLILKNYPKKDGLVMQDRVSMVLNGPMKVMPKATGTASYARFEDPVRHTDVVPDGSWIGCDAGCCVAGALTGFMKWSSRRDIPQDSLLAKP